MPVPALDFSCLHAPGGAPPDKAHAWLSLLAGSARRVAPRGATAQARLCLRWFQDFLVPLGRQPEWREVQAILDWWLVALGHEGPAGLAWNVSDHVADERLGAALQDLLSDLGAGLVPVLRRPIRRAALRAQLQTAVDLPPKMNKAPGPELQREVLRQVRELLAAEEAGRPLPDVELLTLDPEEFASQRRGLTALEKRLKVWNSLYKHVVHLQQTALALRAVAGAAPRPRRTALPAGWREAVEQSRAPGLLTAVLDEVDGLLGGRAVELDPLLAPGAVLDALSELQEGLSRELVVLLLAPVGEACGADPHAEEPAWAPRAQAYVDNLRKSIRTLRSQAEGLKLHDAIEGLQIALGELQELRIDQAQEWEQEARRMIDGAHDDEAVRQLSEELATWMAVLEELDLPSDELPSPELELRQRHRLARDRVEAARADLVQRLRRLEGLLVPGPDREAARQRLDAVQKALADDLLPQARRLLLAADEFILASRSAAQTTLLPGLRDLRERLAGSPLRASELQAFEELASRISLLADEELPYEGLLAAATHFVEVAGAGQLHQLPVLCEVGRVLGLMRASEVHLLAWADTGIPVDASRLRGRVPELTREQLAGHQAGEALLARIEGRWLDDEAAPLRFDGGPLPVPEGTWADLARVEQLDEVRETDLATYPGSRDLRPVLFVQCGERVQGPLARPGVEGRALPADRRGFVARLDADAFVERFGLLRTPSGRGLVPHPPDLDRMLELDDVEPIDSLDAAATEAWLGELLEDLPDLDPAALARAISALEEDRRHIPEPILRARVRRLSEFLETSRSLVDERERAANAYLRTADGRRQIDRAAERLAGSQTRALEARIAQRRVELERALAARSAELSVVEQRLRQARQQEEEQRRGIEQRLEALTEELQVTEALLEDKRALVLARLLSQGRPSSRPDRSPESAGPLRAVDAGLQEVSSLEEGFQALVSGLGSWPERDVANLLVTLLTNSWTLLAGPPGVGKSSFIRAVLTRLGHGPDTDRYLELVVRRDWHDDAPLFGFWHPEQGRWSPSSEGLVEHLLVARDDEERSLGGLYACLLEELNLAPPEHYLARLLSALEDHHPRVRLYAASQSPSNAERYPPSFPVAGNLRLVGTVNIDETVQVLSPRFLSRAAVLWMSPSVDSLLHPPVPAEPPEVPLSWQDLVDQLPGGSPELGPLLQVVRYLHDERVAGAPTPRALRGMERYMAAAVRLLPEAVAQDYQVAQRILPTLRGVGERYRRVFDGLARLLRKHNWPLAAERCEQIRSRGEELGDFYDFFHA